MFKREGASEISLLEGLDIRMGGEIAVDALPFAPGDATAGTENELQAIVVGRRSTVDLPVSIERSQYYANIVRRVTHGEAPRQLVKDLQRFLDDNRDQVWENSWVRFPRRHLSSFASELLEQDLRAGNETRFASRADRHKFISRSKWAEWIRVPISYLLKLALTDVVGTQPNLPWQVRETALRILPHFSNDLTSPETFSFHVVESRSSESLGQAVAAEMSKRFLLTHLLVEWANKILGLDALGQRASVNLTPHPAVRQRELNNCISDAFYRELFVSPCLSGWGDGEAKHEYMLLAHQIASRSQINAVVKLREAGIVTNNLVVLPNTSSVSLANNGTHLSLGSKLLGERLSDARSGFTATDEKRLGDLVIKICEHFLPLFVGTYTAAPYRLAFSDFHPERALGFLPHELDYTHLRMLWRHWKRKADLRVLGRPITPYGPQWIDRVIAKSFGLTGDVVPDYRLIDFPIAWLSTEGASALDGQPGNIDRLKFDLENMGVSDRKLKLYLPMSLRTFQGMGFSGFEGRHYSLFESMGTDFAPAADLQQLITILAYKYALSGKYEHRDVPDDPSSESERRLPFFCAALGLPAFNVRVNTPNDFLRRIATLTRNTRASRHRGYLRIPMPEYCQALVKLIQEDASDCVELLGLDLVVTDLLERLRDEQQRSYGKLLRGITDKTGKADPLAVEAREFNLAAERFYQQELKQKHLKEALDFVRKSIRRHERSEVVGLHSVLGNLDPSRFLNEIESALLADELNPEQLRTLINLVLLLIVREIGDSDEVMRKGRKQTYAEASIYRPAYATGSR